MDETFDFSKSSENPALKSAGATKTIVTDRGEVITLTDTTVYHLDCEEAYQNGIVEDDWGTGTRATNGYPMKLTVKGYDKINQYTDYKQVLFGDYIEQYGLTKGTIYLVCYYTVTKELAQSDDENIRPRDYNNNPDDTAMGWSLSVFNSTQTRIKGFDVSSNPVNGFVTATTMLRHVKCDLAGRSINKYIPYEPSSLVWQYVLSYSLGWD